VDYNLLDSRRLRHLAGGLAAGFAALSALVGGLAAGGWIHFGHAALTSSHALRFGTVWAGAFLLVGLFEEGSFRCYLLFTLTRGINFWWALATVGSLCLLLFGSRDPRGSGGVFVIALLGVVPCWIVHRKKMADSSFWQASWATSAAFGYFHTSNNGENAVGIFAGTGRRHISMARRIADSLRSAISLRPPQSATHSGPAEPMGRKEACWWRL
jgi:hypothetical protein